MANFRILIGLRWFTAVGAVFVGLVGLAVPGSTFDSTPILLVGLGYILFNTATWWWLFRRNYSPAMAACVQIVLDAITLGVLFHGTGGVESPFMVYFVLHLFGTGLILSGAAAVLLVLLATSLMSAIAWLEYHGRFAHIDLWGAVGLYRVDRFVVAVLVAFPVVALLLFALGIGIASRLRKQRRRAVALVEAARTITSTLDVNDVLNHMLQTCATTLDATAGVVRLLSPDGTTLALAAHYGLSDDYIGKGDVNLSDSRIDRQALQGKDVIIEDVDAETRLMYKSSMLLEHLASGVVLPIRSADGHSLGVLRIYSDTPRHFSRTDLPFLQAMTAQAGIALSNALQYQTLAEVDQSEMRFLRTVTHELRAPVAGAQSLMRSLTQGYAGEVLPKQLDVLRRVENRLDSLQDLITDLLDLAAGKESHLIHRSIQLVDVTEYLQRACDSFRDQARIKSIQLESNADLLPELWIRAAPEDVRCILINLIGNAIKYTPEQGRVSATLGWDETWLDLTVSDTGIGIPERDLAHIFEEFFRASNARERERQGTGLGLSIVKNLVDSLEGQIEVRSTLNEGTTFTVHLPLLGVGERPAEEHAAES